MRSTITRRYRRRISPSTEHAFFKKEGLQKQSFFGNSSNKTFFQPALSIQRKCEKCEEDDKKAHRMTDKKEEDKKLQKKDNGTSPNNITNNYISNISGGQNIPKDVSNFYSSRMDHDFSNVKIHTGSDAASSAKEINARAYTTGNHIVFNEGEYNHSTQEGKKLLAHELTHVKQQNENDTGKLQRAVKFNVTEWSAESAGSSTLENKPDFIVVPRKKQILLGGVVEVNGSAADKCDDYEFGTMQTAWMAWDEQYYRGRTPADGSITVKYKSSMPMRDPSLSGSIWYDNSTVYSPSACGDSAGTFTSDGPWEEVYKTRNNSAVAGSPVNYLTGYTRGLHLVSYLAGKEKKGNFLKAPLKYRYWNSIQDFAFTPNYAKPESPWASTGSVKINIGGQGSGETGDAPYYTTAGTTLNTHFNDFSNWTVTERK